MGATVLKWVAILVVAAAIAVIAVWATITRELAAAVAIPALSTILYWLLRPPRSTPPRAVT